MADAERDAWKRCEYCDAALYDDDDEADDDGWCETIDGCDLCPECADGVPIVTEEDQDD